MAGPTSLTLRSYQVGFGDCFLLSFGYSTRDKHILIDFGSTSRPKQSSKKLMKNVAEDIEAVTHGQLDVVVATHRHRDHISGFGGETGEIIAALKPKVVLQPWTEDPKAARDATKAKKPTQRSLLEIRALDHMQHIAELAHRHAKRLRGVSKSLRDQLQFLGEENIANKKAVVGLQKMGKKRKYLKEGDSAGLGRILPGVKTHVLGPPNLQQSDKIKKYAKRHEEEYWHFAASAASYVTDTTTPFDKKYIRGRVLPYARWFQRRLKDLQAEQFLQIVRRLDSVLNNTSLILLFETKDHFFLFPGDAQLENWTHALSKDKYTTLLKKVLVYKVGHHGSLNATPKSLWKLFENRKKRGDDRLATLMSTMDGKHGHEESNTEVPRRTLTSALHRETDLFDTRELSADEICHEIRFDF